MEPGQPQARKPGMNPALKYVLLGCGGILVLSVLSVAGISYLVYRKAQRVKQEWAAKGLSIDTSHGAKGMAYSMTVSLVRSMEPAVLLALPKSEHAAADKAFQDLAAKGGALTEQDMKDLDAALKAYNAANRKLSEAGKPPFDPGAARTFVQAIQTIADRH